MRFKLPKGWFPALSLKQRIQWLTALLVGLVTAFAMALYVRESRIAGESMEIAISAYSQKVLQMRVDLGPAPQGGERIGEGENTRFGRDVEEARREMQAPEAQGMLNEISSLFARMRESLEEGRTADAADEWRSIHSVLFALDEWNKNSTYAGLNRLVQRERESARQAIILFLVFFTVLSVLGIKLIGRVTEPLTQFTRFMDSLDPEGEVPLWFPWEQFRGAAPEIHKLMSSCDSLLKRLRSHRAVNLRRVLAEKHRFEIIAAAISDGVILLRGGREIYANPVGKRILGSYNLGVPPNPGISTGSVGATSNQVPQAPLSGAEVVWRATARTIPQEYSFEQDGRHLHFLISAIPLSEGFLQSIPNEEGAAAETASGEPEVLVLAQDVTLVKESHEAKIHFLATLSHEVKTPVTSLIMAIRLLERVAPTLGNATVKSLIDTCNHDVERLRRLLDDLLHASRLDTLEMQGLSIRDVDFGKLLRHTIQGFAPAARERGVKIDVSVDPSVKSTVVPMDPSKVVWAISHLLVNALRHSPRGGEMRVHASMGEGHVQLGVKDGGPGIDPKIQGRIFEKFSPFYDIRVARTGSTGMGLAIAKEIVTAHGGRIWVNSVPGEGAEFSFTLPLGRGAQGTGQGSGTTSSGRAADGPADGQGRGVVAGPGAGAVNGKFGKHLKGEISGTSACG